MSSRSKVLILNQDSETCSDLAEWLQAESVGLDVATSVSEARDQDWSQYLAILLDRNPPRRECEALLRDWKQLAPDAAVILSSGPDALGSEDRVEVDHDQLQNLGPAKVDLRQYADDLLIKPWHPEVVQTTIARIKRVNEDNQRAARLAVIGQIVTAVAHESRNYLQKITAATDFLRLIVRDDGEACQELDSIATAEKGLEHLLEDLRDYAAPITLTKQSKSLQSVWRSVWEEFQATTKDSVIQLDDRDCDRDLVLPLDEFRMSQVFRNLFQNSLAACRDNASIWISCHRHNGHFLLHVRDNGSGLSEEQQSQVFRPFYTTKPKGTGLGMTIVKRIVEAHDGEIKASREIENGAEFVLTLPANA
ncbi:MAG: ATP-binding protein [Planctomycetota bacterium]